MKTSSLFDIIAPIMVGPSSSHTAGAVRLGLLAKNIYHDCIKKVDFKLYNSYAQTGKGHGTDKGLLAGILGFSVDDERIKNIFDLDISKTIEYSFEFLTDFNRHPNAVDFKINDEMFISGDSIGAGEIRITKINDFSVNLAGDYDTLMLIYKDKPGMIYKVSTLIQDEDINIASLHCDRNEKGQQASMCVCVDDEIEDTIVNRIQNYEDVYWVRNIRKLD